MVNTTLNNIIKIRMEACSLYNPSAKEVLFCQNDTVNILIIRCIQNVRA